VDLNLFLMPKHQPTFGSLVMDEAEEQVGSFWDQPSYPQSVVSLDR